MAGGVNQVTIANPGTPTAAVEIFDLKKMSWKQAGRLSFARALSYTIEIGKGRFMAIGGAIMGGLMLLRQQLVWWPLHPIGFPISLVIHKMFFTVLLAWLIKTTILRYGGPKLFGRLRPFFLGLILGDFVPLGTLIVLDRLFQ